MRDSDILTSKLATRVRSPSPAPNGLWNYQFMRLPATPVMSDDVEIAEWVRSRLRSPEEHVVTSIVPTGFDAYAKVLHPAQLPDDRHELVRWSAVSRWSNVTFDARVQWHQIALPQETPSTQPPWRGQGPRTGSPFSGDVEALIADLARATATPDSCYFCLWTGHLGGGVQFSTSGTSERLPPAPRPSKLVQFPWREYVLFEGPLTCATSFELVNHWPGEATNLWWPSDRTWCVASEIDLDYTLVGGSTELIDHVLGNERLEALPATENDSIVVQVDEWLAQRVDDATDDVLSIGSTRLALSMGTVEVTMRQSGVLRHGSIHSESVGINGASSGDSPVRTREPQHLRLQIHRAIEQAVLALI